LVGSGVGGADSDGIGAIVGDVVCVGGEVGAPAGSDGAAVRGAVAVGSVAAGPGRVCGGAALVAGVEEALLDGAADPLGVGWPLASRVRLNPARATPIASDGPSRTYRVKEARPT
jgi:hypothetical protein